MKINIFRRSIAVLLLLGAGIASYAQNITVSGVIRDANTNEPIIGAAVMVKGQSTGTVSNEDGSYSLKAAGDATLVCQYFGYKNLEVNVANRGKIDFLLEEDVEQLEATVVVGYGTLKKTQLVGSVENLSGDVIEDRPNANVTRSLQGQVAGLNIIQVDGKASHTGKIYVRGNATSYYSRTNFNSSASGSSHSIGNGGSALILIDGVEGDLTSVNPADIETVAVLKDASSAAIYGARGCYGVILVTTKTAKGEKLSVSYNGSVSLNTRAIKWEDQIVTDGLEWTEAFYEFYGNDANVPGSSGKVPTTINTTDIALKSGSYLDLLRQTRALEAEGLIEHSDYLEGYGKNGQYLYNGNTNWLGMFYKKMTTATTHDISVKGSSKKISYSLTGRYYGQEGIYKVGQDDYRTFNVRAKAKVQVTDWLSFDNNTSLFTSYQKQPMFTTSSVLGKQLDQHGAPVLVPYNEDGTYTLAANKTAYASFLEGNTGQTDKGITVVTKTGMTIDIIKNVLNIRGDFSYKAIRKWRERYRAPLSFYAAPGSKTEYVTQESSYKSRWTYDYDYITANVVATWTPRLGENHDLNVVGGWNLENYQYDRFYIQRKGMLYPDMYTSYELFDGTDIKVEQNGNSYGIIGFFARANYTLLRR